MIRDLVLFNFQEIISSLCEKLTNSEPSLDN